MLTRLTSTGSRRRQAGIIDKTCPGAPPARQNVNMACSKTLLGRVLFITSACSTTVFVSAHTLQPITLFKRRRTVRRLPRSTLGNKVEFPRTRDGKNTGGKDHDEGKTPAPVFVSRSSSSTVVADTVVRDDLDEPPTRTSLVELQLQESSQDERKLQQQADADDLLDGESDGVLYSDKAPGLEEAADDSTTGTGAASKNAKAYHGHNRNKASTLSSGGSSTPASGKQETSPAASPARGSAFSLSSVLQEGDDEVVYQNSNTTSFAEQGATSARTRTTSTYSSKSRTELGVELEQERRGYMGERRRRGQRPGMNEWITINGVDCLFQHGPGRVAEKTCVSYPFITLRDKHRRQLMSVRDHEAYFLWKSDFGMEKNAKNLAVTYSCGICIANILCASSNCKQICLALQTKFVYAVFP